MIRSAGKTWQVFASPLICTPRYLSAPLAGVGTVAADRLESFEPSQKSCSQDSHTNTHRNTVNVTGHARHTHTQSAQNSLQILKESPYLIQKLCVMQFIV